jgi:hypothetical protein
MLGLVGYEPKAPGRNVGCQEHRTSDLLLKER